MSKIIELNKRRSQFILCTRNNFHLFEADEYYYVESYHYDPIPDVKYLEDLAPSYDLHQFLKDIADKSYITKKDIDYFTSQYLVQINQKIPQQILAHFQKQIEQGRTILLFSDEKIKKLNHLTILGDYVKALGYQVHTRINSLKSSSIHTEYHNSCSR